MQKPLGQCVTRHTECRRRGLACQNHICTRCSKSKNAQHARDPSGSVRPAPSAALLCGNKTGCTVESSPVPSRTHGTRSLSKPDLRIVACPSSLENYHCGASVCKTSSQRKTFPGINKRSVESHPQHVCDGIRKHHVVD